MNRSAKTWLDDIKDILTHSSVLSPKIQKLSIVQDTIVKLDWTNQAADYDSIYIERRTLTSTFKKIASLKGDTTTFSESKLSQNQEYYYRVVAHYTNKPVLFSNPQKILLPTYIPKEPVFRELFTGQAPPIPGRIEMENFDIGEDGLTYHDLDLKNTPQDYRPMEPVDILNMGNGIYYVIDNYPGEWLEYTVNVAEKGIYNISASIADFAGGGTFRVKIGTVESEIISAPTTYSWTKAKPVNFSMDLESGIQIMRISFIAKPLFYIDYMDFTKTFTLQTSQICLKDGFTVFQKPPNLIFKLGIGQPVEVMKIYNILGTIVKVIEHPEANFVLPIQDLHTGVYIVQAISGEQKFSKKIVIQ
jgi:hypothetical protein